MQIFFKLLLCNASGHEERMRLNSEQEARREHRTLEAKSIVLNASSTNVRVVD
jgi:hypothetical protein